MANSIRKSLPDQLRDRALVDGHFVFKSGNHSLVKFEFDRIAEHRRLLRKTCRAMGRLIAENFTNCDAVLTVGNGANCMAEAVAGSASRELHRPIRPLVSTKRDGRFLTGNKIHIAGRNLVVVDDALTHGTSVTELVESLSDYVPAAINVAVVANRSMVGITELPNPLDPEKPMRVASLLDIKLDDYPADMCPLRPEESLHCELPTWQS